VWVGCAGHVTTWLSVSVCVTCGQPVVRQSVGRQRPPHCHGSPGQLSAASRVGFAAQSGRDFTASVALDAPVLGLCPAYGAPLCKTVGIAAFARGWPREAKRERSGPAYPIPTVSVETVTEDEMWLLGACLSAFLLVRQPPNTQSDVGSPNWLTPAVHRLTEI